MKDWILIMKYLTQKEKIQIISKYHYQNKKKCVDNSLSGNLWLIRLCAALLLLMQMPGPKRFLHCFDIIIYICPKTSKLTCVNTRSNTDTVAEKYSK